MTEDTGAPKAAVGGDLVRFRIVGMPVETQMRAQQHVDGLIRELTLLGEGMRQQGSTGELPARLVALVDELTRTYSGLTAEQAQQLDIARATGHHTVDLTYRLPASVVDAVRALDAILDEADEYCRAGRHLLTLATPPELVTFRRWYLDEFTRQSAGHPPRTWAEYTARGDAAESNGCAGLEAEATY